MTRWSSARGSATVRRVVLLLIAGVFLAAIAQLWFGAGHRVLFGIAGNGSAAVSPSPASEGAQGRSDRFGISGGVNGLYPGASLPLVLTISNPHEFKVVVTSVTTLVGTPNAGCSSTNLTVTPFSGSLPVPADGTAQLTVMATLSHAAPDACQGAVFPLEYKGTVVKP